MTPERLRLAFCVATHRRPDGLVALLRSIEALDVPEAVDLHIAIADNDPEGGAVSRVGHLRDQTRWPLHVVHEPRPGVSAPRNASVALALDAAPDLLAFVDDDEVLPSSWLVTHLAGRDRHGAAVTTGPVRPLFPDDTPGWWPSTGIHGPEDKPDGTLLPVCWTNNTVVSREVVEDVTPWFDDTFRWGGEDAEFFSRVGDAGHRIVWLAAAAVEERVPATRLRLRWVATRFYRNGHTKAAVERRRRGGSIRVALRRVAVGAFYLLRAATWIPRLRLPAGHRLAMATRDLTFGLGQLAGIVGIRPPGRPRG